MRFRLGFEVSIGRLGPMRGCPADDPRNGRITLYVTLCLGRTTLYLARWDSERVDPHRLEWRGEVMTVYAGRH